MGRRPALRARGFTLIEILVVVAIIALLVAILLPSLARAKEQTRTVACASKLSQIGRAENAYASEQKDWILGSPWSTGFAAMISTVNSNDWNTFSNQNRLIVDWYDHSTPIRAQNQGSKSIPRDRNQMLVQFTQGLFQCDSNPHTAVPFPIGAAAPTIQAISYLSPWSLMRAGPAGYTKAQTMPFTGVGGSAGWVAQSSSWEMALPTDYFPRHAKLGRDSMKVFMADGFRFLVEKEANSGEGYADYDASGFRNSKGIGNVDEPPSSAGSDFNKMYNIARKYAYRHSMKNAMNAAFFDGHVSLLRVDYQRAAGNSDPGSGFTGDAVHPKYYYPSGTVVNQAGYLHLPIPVGTKLP